MISKIIRPRFPKISTGLFQRPLFTPQCTIHLNFSLHNTHQKRFYARKEIESEYKENVFIPPVHYPKGILRTDIASKGRLGGEGSLSGTIWKFVKQTSRKGARGKLSLVLGFIFIISLVSFVINFYTDTQNNLTIALKDADKLRVNDLRTAAEYYTARDFPRILAAHPIFNYSSPIVLQQHSAVSEVMEMDSFGFARAIKTKFSLPPSLDIQLYFSTEIQPNYVTRLSSYGTMFARPDYEYLIHFNKIVLFFVKEKKSQVIPRTDKFFPKRNILSGAHYQFLYEEYYKNTRRDEINLQKSGGKINEDSEAKMIEREMELQRQDKAIKEHQDVKKR